MKRTDKVTVTISADTLVLIWHYLNGLGECQTEFRRYYGNNMPEKRSGQFNEVDVLCDNILGKDAIRNYVFDDDKHIKLNDEYSAEIGEDTVKVGCTEFTHDAVKKLYKAIKQSKK